MKEQSTVIILILVFFVGLSGDVILPTPAIAEANQLPVPVLWPPMPRTWTS